VVGVPNDQTDPVGPSGNNICGSIHHFGVPSHVDDRSPRIVYLVAGKQLWIVRLAGGVISIVFDVPHGNGNIGIGDHCKVDLFSGGEVGEQEGEDITGDALPFPVFVGSEQEVEVEVAGQGHEVEFQESHIGDLGGLSRTAVQALQILVAVGVDLAA